jgi:hypothetical protein
MTTESMETGGSPKNVIAGLDPAIHLLPRILLLDGCADQVRA